MEGAALLQLAATALLNGSFAWLAGSLCARWWLAAGYPQLLRHCAPAMRRAEIAASIMCLLAGGAALWAGTALMAGVDLREAAVMLPMMLAETAYGRVGMLAVMAAFAAGLGLAWFRSLVPAAAALLVFVLSRASISHAGDSGMFSAAFAIEAAHLLAVGVWAGGVAIAAWMVVPAARTRRLLMPAYLSRLSQAASVALAAIIASGAWNSWQRLAAPSDMVAHPYGIALTVKLLLFALAVALGAYNKFAGFPGEAQNGKGPSLPVLRLESLVLLCALVAAAALASQQPPD